MKNENDSLSDVFNGFINRFVNNENYYHKLGVVESVNETDFTFVFTPNDDTPPITVDMSVMPSGTSAFIIVPEINSRVIVGFSNKEDAYCVLTEKAKSIIFNGGNNGGLINIVDLVSKVNNIENMLNGFVSKYNTHIHPVPLATAIAVPPALGTTTPTVSTEPTVLVPTTRDDIEDTNITH